MLKSIIKGVAAAVLIAGVFLAAVGMKPVQPPYAPVLSISETAGESRRVVEAPVKSDGTFLQWWMVKDWDDARWEREFSILKEVGMHFIVLEPSAFYHTDVKTGRGVTRTVYPTNIKDFETIKRDDGSRYPDVVDTCLRNAQKKGFKVFIGLNFSDEWWDKRRDAEWIYARIREGNRIADELWEKYYSRYPEAFYGWYWCWEVDNAYFKRFDPYDSAGILVNAINLFTGHLEATDRRLPVMIAPYMNWMLGTPQGHASLWEYVLENSGMKDGDILCPQDSIGAGGLTINNVSKWFAELRKVVDQKPGVQLWVDTETFDVRDWTGFTINRFIEQMDKVKPYVDNYISFSYSHYYSPNIVDPGFHKTYEDYIRSGSLEVISPGVPANVTARVLAGGRVELKWSPASDNTGVCGYYIIRNGRKVANVQVPRAYGDEAKPKASTNAVDKVGYENRTYTYEIQAYDFAGNLSEKSAPVTVAQGGLKKD
jgi:hypothetical protein